MINFTRAFDSAWERMMVILFRPFDLGKWCVIGFNSSYRQNFSPSTNSAYNAPFHQFQTGVSHFFSSLQLGMTILLACAVFIFIMAFIVLLYWLGARGQFLLLDNIVRNRGAIGWPWTFYARPANQVFVLYLIFLAVSLGVLLVLVVPAVILALPLYQHPHWPEGGTLFGLVTVALVYLAAVIVMGCVIFIFREWGVPLMFRNGLTARGAFVESMGLARRHPGPTILFILLRMALWIALAIVSVLACCFTCCFAILPYIGTVVLLPALIYIRCFSLDCLAQFGPAYDVWTVDVPPAEAPPSLPFSPPPPLG
jgi:hypothetical protein